MTLCRLLPIFVLTLTIKAMKRIFTIVLEGKESSPVLIVADAIGSAFSYASTLSEPVIAVQAGPEVEVLV